MKTTEKIFISGILATTFMTLYSYWRSKREKKQYVEPILLNKLIGKADNRLQISDENTHPLGWGLHYIAGIGFVASYRFLWHQILKKPTLLNILASGILSGIAGVVVWDLLFKQNKKSNRIYRYGYYRQLLVAHVIFAAFGLYTYKGLEYFKINKHFLTHK